MLMSRCFLALMDRLRILGKFSGAVGNYNAHVVSYPEVNWPHIAEQFVQSLGLSFNPYVAQIETHDYMAKLFHLLIQFNNILIEFDRDVWGYISLGYFNQTTKAGEVGSSTMPHKVNPIDFENSEGNLGVANGEGLDRFNCLKEHGCRHRAFSSCLQKHTSRNREASVYCSSEQDAYTKFLSLTICITSEQVNEARLSEDLNQCWEVLAEPIQTVMRRYGVSEPYEKLKELTRGRAVTQKSIRDFIEGLYIPEEAKMNLLKLTPDTYVGAAVELARTVKNVVNTVYGRKI
ncbi:Adenylosuccinate lyase [Glycine soja]|uniref:Adenylosuccinate lyase n=1 Tax=Glycine soja TaxID=3848 RepID=A0A445ISP3_GLYSO|nr:Adenylosuccinate lyase [Glycine soja]